MFGSRYIVSVECTEPFGDWDWSWDFESKGSFECDPGDDSRELTYAISRVVVRCWNAEWAEPNIQVVVCNGIGKIKVLGRGKPLTYWERFRLKKLFDHYLERYLGNESMWRQ